VFLTEFDRATGQLATLGIDRRTGKILWRRTVAPAQIEKVHALRLEVTASRISVSWPTTCRMAPSGGLSLAVAKKQPRRVAR
jgi:hypothetical protein